MTYNIHPIFVHFPIALLLLYSVIKILPLKKWIPAISWHQIERLLLITGIMGAFAALVTGDIAEHLIRPNQDLSEAHSLFAGIATGLYVAILVGEISHFITERQFGLIKNNKIFISIIRILDKVLTNPIFSSLLAFLGLIAISVTGLLGGVMAFGLSADPFAPFVLRILGINL